VPYLHELKHFTIYTYILFIYYIQLLLLLYQLLRDFWRFILGSHYYYYYYIDCRVFFFLFVCLYMTSWSSVFCAIFIVRYFIFIIIILIILAAYATHIYIIYIYACESGRNLSKLFMSVVRFCVSLEIIPQHT